MAGRRTIQRRDARGDARERAGEWRPPAGSASGPSPSAATQVLPVAPSAVAPQDIGGIAIYPDAGAAPSGVAAVQRLGPAGGIAPERDLGARIRAAAGGGQPLPSPLQRRLEAGLEADLSAVRLHTDGEADALSRAVDAVAFTSGPDIFFRAGAYAPATPHGLHTLAHEAAHTIQQAAGPVAGTPAPGGVAISDPADRFEQAAETSANRVTADAPVSRVAVAARQADAFERPVSTPARGPSSGEAVPIQRFREEKRGSGNFIFTYIILDADESGPPDDGFKYSAVADEPGTYKRVGKKPTTKGMSDDQLRAKMAAEALASRNKPKETLYEADEGGAVEGTFEYVANYLFTEMWKANQGEAEKLWASFLANGRKRRAADIPDKEKRLLLTRMMEFGLESFGNAKPIATIKTELQQSNTRGQDVRILQPAEYAADPRDVTDPVVGAAPLRQPIGIGFHSTDKGPDVVAAPKDSSGGGGWGGIQRPSTVEYFQKRYALGKNVSWNPLKRPIERGENYFRKGIKDNELLSVVSVAIVVRDTIKFPLAAPSKGKKVEHGGAPAFEMHAYIYAVAVRSAFNTAKRQKDLGTTNPFGEIGVHSIPIDDLIGCAEIVRFHDLEQRPGGKEYPKDSCFEFEIGELKPLAAGERYPKLFAAAKAEVEKLGKSGRFTENE